MYKIRRYENPRSYLLNCFLLVLPVLLWNIVLAAKLPAVFQPASFGKDIPRWLSMTENISRSLLFLTMLFFPLHKPTYRQKAGLALYGVGIAVYFASWIAVICSPSAAWSSSLAGFMAPAYTPLIWLAGIGIAAGSPFVSVPFLRRYYFILAGIFILAHCGHTYLVFSRSKALAFVGDFQQDASAAPARLTGKPDCGS